jgi:uncharacterized protein with ATP-grasp and redox domains
MKTTFECLPCMFRQAMLTAQAASDDPAQVFAAVQAAAQHVASANPDLSPPENALPMTQTIMRVLGTPDPFRADMDRLNALALRAYPALKAYVESAPDPLEAAVRVAAAGNVMDLTVFDAGGMDVDAIVAQAQAVTWAISHLDRLKRDLAGAERVLILADNAGEIVFDRPLVDLLPPGTVTVAVKSGPAANDATRIDAQQAGLDRVAHIVESGTTAQGTPLRVCSDEFRAVFDAADVIIAKGQGNFETLTSQPNANLYFILKVKCRAVGSYLGVPEGAILLLSQGAQLASGAV